MVDLHYYKARLNNAIGGSGQGYILNTYRTVVNEVILYYHSIKRRRGTFREARITPFQNAAGLLLSTMRPPQEIHSESSILKQKHNGSCSWYCEKGRVTAVNWLPSPWSIHPRQCIYFAHGMYHTSSKSNCTVSYYSGLPKNAVCTPVFY